MSDNEKTDAGRREILKSGLALAGATAAGGLWPTTNAFAQSDFDWKRFKGEKIEVSLQKRPFHDVLQKYEPEFTALTGIEVVSEQAPEQQYRQKLAIEICQPDGASKVLVPLTCRIDTLDELEYFRNGGILQYVLRQLAA